MEKAKILDILEDKKIREKSNQQGKVDNKENINKQLQNKKEFHLNDINEDANDLLNTKSSYISHCEDNSFIQKKTQRDHFDDNLSENDCNPDPDKMLRINIFSDRQNQVKLTNPFKPTHLLLQDTYTLDFISRFICFKQNYSFDLLKNIAFYTLNQNQSKIFWSQHDTIKDIFESNKILFKDLVNEVSSLTLNDKNSQKSINIYFQIN